ncbi:uncharacterized protein SPPG_04634 [Spizellomyces punctatus DAOM BR117]|uniref:Large ribosomal subunit protein mL43 n=1 Tax=Spizellomyces punctatus (strain DAOM BR117) TaxID=645134 RepID=A0A0L0HHK5_SPIPD|nr:uncharacterized protein SPPG_04634 [Spizellomyces punctatus DAOM BR117]KND00309.1 hypothetical protein SPPG_04634 [Spizellomyces punctatus DAOM BR117]|eukprot:XP_016608348.1 hypothetical protein SPPG_04634 [Spizellomyces punctatus DAOM BR117]
MSTPKTLIKKLQEAGLHKRILPPKDLTSRTHNGAGGAFVPQITKLTIHYDHPRIDAGGNSRGMVKFLLDRLPTLAAERPYVEICVQPRRASPPKLVATYANGKVKAISCSKFTPEQIEKQVAFLCDSMDGEEKRVKRGQPVIKGGNKMAGRVEGVWDPFTARQTFRP